MKLDKMGRDSGVAWPKWEESLMISLDDDTSSEMRKLLLSGFIPSLLLFWTELVRSFIVCMGIRKEVNQGSVWR